MDYYTAELEGRALTCEICGCPLSVDTYENNQGVCTDCLDKQ